MLTLNSPGLGFTLGLFISPLLLLRTETFQPLKHLGVQCQRLYNVSGRGVQDPDDHSEVEGGSGLVGEEKLAAELAQKVKVLCWVLTLPTNHQVKVTELSIIDSKWPKFTNFDTKKSHGLQARHVKATWGSRCNKLLFMSSEADPDLPAVKLNVSEGRDNLWDKTRNAFQYVYNKHYQDQGCIF